MKFNKILMCVLLLGTLLSSKSYALEDNSMVMIKEKTQSYTDDNFKSKSKIIPKDTIVYIDKIENNRVSIKYDGKKLYINKEDIDYKNINEIHTDSNKPKVSLSNNVSEIDISKIPLVENLDNDTKDNISKPQVKDIMPSSYYPELDKTKKEEYYQGEKMNAMFTAYYPENSLMEGGFYDALGKRLNPKENTCAAPKEIPFGSQIQIMGTGTYMDGEIFTVRDRGGAIKKRGDQYQFDLLTENRMKANLWGRRYGYVRIVRWGW